MLQVKTKTVQQCVEFFYLNKKLRDKQEKHKQENQDGGLEQQAGVIHAALSRHILPVHLNRKGNSDTVKDQSNSFKIPHGVKIEITEIISFECSISIYIIPVIANVQC